MSAGIVLALHSIEIAIEGVERSQYVCQQKELAPKLVAAAEAAAAQRTSLLSIGCIRSAIGAAVSRSWQVGVVHEHSSVCSIATRFVKGLVLWHMPALMTES